VHIDPFLVWLESTALSRWVVESPSVVFGFPGIISLHAIGMGFAVGLSAMTGLRILGAAPDVPLPAFRRYSPLLWTGFWVNAVSGVLLLIGYPTKALTNPVFYLKLVMIAVAMSTVWRIERAIDAGVDVDAPRLRRLAVTSLVCWTAAVTAGRLLAYTFTRLRAS
jgi:hypothetical protein